MAQDKADQRIPFGTNGIKDGNGKIIRSDIPTFGDAVEGTLKKLTPGFLRNRKAILDKEVDRSAAEVQAMKALQDKLAGIIRRS